jgi:hypothetical protein
LKRRQRFLLFTHGLTAASHVVVGLALARWLAPGLAAAVAVALFVLVTWRFRAIAHDRKRPRWQTLAVDEPVFCHWGAGLLGLALLPAGILVAALSPDVSVPEGALASYAGGLAVSLWSVYGARRRIRTTTVRVALSRLPPAFAGYRIAQLTDLHVGSFSPRSEALGWAARANALEPDLTVVTGDLVTAGTSFYEDAADVIGALRARDGVYVVLGNHDQWDAARFVAVLESRGVRVLQNAWRSIARNGSDLIVAGLGDRYTRRDDLDATLAGRPDGAPTILLAHYPESFEAAVRRGVDLVLSGHTHGGQIGLPFIGDRANIARLVGQRGRGLVRNGASQLYVSAGLGTTGPPMRLGVLPEIAVLELEPEAADA